MFIETYTHVIVEMNYFFNSVVSIKIVLDKLIILNLFTYALLHNVRHAESLLVFFFDCGLQIAHLGISCNALVQLDTEVG